MFDTLIRIYVVIGLAVIGLRGVLYELGMAPWVVMLSLVLAITVLYGVNHMRDAAEWLHGRLGAYLATRRTA